MLLYFQALGPNARFAKSLSKRTESAKNHPAQLISLGRIYDEAINFQEHLINQFGGENKDLNCITPRGALEFTRSSSNS